MEKAIENKEFKLNYKRTLIIGFAFFGILLLWQVYDTWCPLFLTELFKSALNTDNERQVTYIVGIVMAMDNLAALLLMPLFGRLSDKTHTKLGKRMPYILVGTAVCAIAFPFIPVFFMLNNIVGTIIMMAVILLFAMMYRNPAVSLMPDMTPKPLRSKANGLINIMGYLGGAFASVVGMIFVFKRYLGIGDYAGDPQTGNPWLIEAPFLIASALMLISAVVLFVLVKENKIAEEVKDEMARGELVAESAEKLSEDDDAPLSKANKIMLFLILGAEFFWFMADNGVSTFLSSYIQYNTGGSTLETGILTIVGGVGSVIGFVFGGIIAGKIGRKWTLLSGLFLTVTAYLFWFIFTKTLGITNGFMLFNLPLWLYILWFVKGFGMSLVHVNSYPMVVELCTGKKIGQFTGYYYAASMTAQTITPIAFGALLLAPSFDWNTLPAYAGICIVASIAIFLFVKNVKSRKTQIKTGLSALDQED